MNSLNTKDDIVTGSRHVEQTNQLSNTQTEEEIKRGEVENLIDGEYHDVTSDDDAIFLFYD